MMRHSEPLPMLAADYAAADYLADVVAGAVEDYAMRKAEERAFDAGVEAGREGFPTSACMHPPGAVREAWMTGHSVGVLDRDHDFEEEDDDNPDWLDDPENFDCHMMPSGVCLAAGTEDCDWDCPNGPSGAKGSMR